MISKFFNWLFKPQTKTLYIIRGISGSGKSSLAQQLTPWNVAADDLPGLYINGRYQLELQKQSHQWCEAQIEKWMRQGKTSIAVHNTFVKPRYCEPYVTMAAKYGYSVAIIAAEGVILPSGERAKNVHGVSDEILERQAANWESLVCE